jgi:hypothetical protein
VRPVHTWTRFDVGLAAVALPFLAFGLWGVTTIAGTLSDVAALDQDCRLRECFHHGVLVDHALGVITRGGRFVPGPTANYCVLTMQLDNGTWQAAVNASYCSGLANGTQVDAEIWRSQVVAVRSSQGQTGTYVNPEVGIPVGLTRALGLVPAGLLIAMIHYDVVNRHIVPRLRRRPAGGSHFRRGAS